MKFNGGIYVEGDRIEVYPKISGLIFMFFISFGFLGGLWLFTLLPPFPRDPDKIITYIYFWFGVVFFIFTLAMILVFFFRSMFNKPLVIVFTDKIGHFKFPSMSWEITHFKDIRLIYLSDTGMSSNLKAERKDGIDRQIINSIFVSDIDDFHDQLLEVFGRYLEKRPYHDAFSNNKDRY